MTRKKMLALILTILLLSVAMLTGCGKDEQAADGEKVLRMAWSVDIGPMNPHLYGINQMFAQAMVYEPLVNYSKDGKVIPWLAKSWDISEDGKTYTFHLRDDVKFSDGSQFNAKNVERNFAAVLANAQRHNWLGLIGEIDSVKAVDDFTVQIAFKNAYYPALQELTLIRPVRFLGDAGFPEGDKTSESIVKPIGTGPWVLESYEKDKQAVFVRNENYWGEKPAIDKIIVKIIPDNEAIALALENDEIDLIFGSGLINLNSYDEFTKGDKFGTAMSVAGPTRNVAMNSNKGATKDLKVRQALELALNKDALVAGVFYGTEEKANFFFAENFPYCNVGLKAYDYDVAAAEKLLDEAGWVKKDGEQFRSKNGETLALDLCFVGNDAVQKAVSEVMQADYAKIGVKINLVGEEKQSFLDRQQDGNFHLIFGATNGAPYQPHADCASMLHPSHADFQAQVGLPMKKELDDKIGQVLISTDENARQALYKDILTILHDQAVYIPITYKKNLAVFNKKVTGVDFNPSEYEIPFIDMDIK